MLFGLVLTLSTCPAASDMDAEEIFADALAYTVRIKTRIETPFIEDTRGAFTGAGFVVDNQRRWIMTNAHVVGHSPSFVRVAVHEGGYDDAEKVYVDPYLDLAILKLPDDRQQLTAASLECESEPGTGHPVGAFGHPWGLDYTGTRGIVSGKTAKVGGELLQTDAPINDGNSGGPLISLKTGRIVGINTAGINEEGDEGTNFAVSIVQACRILKLLRAGHDPSPPDLPFAFFNLAYETDPLIVARIYPGAEAFPLQVGDEIMKAGDKPIANEGQLIHALRGNLNDIALTVRRNDEIIAVAGRLSPSPRVTRRRGIKFGGMLLAPGNFRDRSIYTADQDIMVHSVARGSEGQDAGLSFYDFLIAIDGVAVTDLDHAYDLLKSASAYETVQLEFFQMTGNPDLQQLFDSLLRDFSPQLPEQIGNWSAPVQVSQQ